MLEDVTPGQETPGGLSPKATLIRRYAFAPFIAVSVVHLLSIGLGFTEFAQGSKGLLMPALILAFALKLHDRRQPLALATVTALAFSWLGDVFLLLPQDLFFLLGLGAFFVTHVLYVRIFFRLGTGRLSGLTAGYLVAYATLIWVLGPNLGGLFVPVALYGLVLVGGAVLATRVNSIAAWGAGLFVLSDSVLALNRFAPGFELWAVDFVVMVSYLVGQALIVLGLLRALSPTDDTDAEPETTGDRGVPPRPSFRDLAD